MTSLRESTHHCIPDHPVWRVHHFHGGAKARPRAAAATSTRWRGERRGATATAEGCVFDTCGCEPDPCRCEQDPGRCGTWCLSVRSGTSVQVCWLAAA